MPLSDKQLGAFRETIRRDKVNNLNSTLGVASEEDPAQFAEIERLHGQTGIHPDIIRERTDEVRKAVQMKNTNVRVLSERSPMTSKWLQRNPANAIIAQDDIENLEGHERSVRELNFRKGYWENQVNHVINNAAKVGTEGAAMAVWGLEEASKVLTKPLDEITGWLTGKRGNLEEMAQRAEEEAREWLQEREESAEAYYAPEHRADLKKVIEDPSVSTVAEFIAEAGPGQIPYLIAAGISMPLISTVVGNMVAEEHAQANNLEGLPDDRTMAIGALTGFVSGAIEKYALNKLFRGGPIRSDTGFGRYATTEIPKAIAREAGTEFIQESIEYTGAYLGTEKGFDPGDMFEQGLAGAILGGAMGGGIRAATIRPDYNRQIYIASAKESFNKLESLESQDWLDDRISLAQSSKVSDVEAERFREFLNEVDPESHVYIPAEIAAKIADAPDYITSQIDGTGADVSISMSDFLVDFARNEELLSQVRPYVKVREDLKNQIELEEKGDSETVKRLIEQAEKHEAVKTEADMIYEQVKDQIVASRRQGEATARLSAQLIPAYITTKHAELQSRGIDVSVKDLYEDMGLSVAGPSAKIEREGGVEMSQEDLKTVSSDLKQKYGLDQLVLVPSKGDIALTSIVVPEEMRGQGVGTSVINELKSVADQQGRSIVLEPEEDTLVPFYEGLGFEILGDGTMRYTPADQVSDAAVHQKRLDAIEQVRRCVAG